MTATARKHPRQDRSKATVKAIVEATARVLVDEGFGHVTTNRVAKVAGVSVGSLYQYFPNKEALIMAVAERHAQMMVDLLGETMTDLSDQPIEVAVRTYVEAMIQAHLIDPALHHALITLVLQVGLEQFREIDHAALALIEAYLSERQDQILCTDLPTTAWVLLTTVESLIHIAALERFDLLEDGKLQREICAVVLRYLGVQESVTGP
ncbi:MAG: TetR/AcrR family transcriptional regulator [Myxococcales bacterium]|nr:TetR/AcrR family transcriptional regulator [Myxococcales bacterium]